ncbi:TetR/AcrR family transcriptional regulator [Haloarchaeobius amylolyticus]|uniref:TetR/AcrR family transcriptional regulator n=1 Tax=Haloarchaeobius amylolyticus TaxID=1198296 RepID=UPI00226F8F3B|nr:TetR/AcrR family transcriptional regulator [Haloarchaeobius amylolyticus]
MRGFSDEERDRIRANLRSVGRRQFTKFGLEKTTVSDLTEDLSIGRSTFYRFYDSKEELYLELLEAEGEAVAERMAAEGIGQGEDPEAVVKDFLEFIFQEIESNNLLRAVLIEDELDRLRESRTEAERKADRQEDIAVIRSFIDPFIEAGRLHGTDPTLVARSIAAIPYLSLHEADIGEDHYPEVRDFVIETFARGLAVEDGSTGTEGSR